MTESPQRTRPPAAPVVTEDDVPAYLLEGPFTHAAVGLVHGRGGDSGDPPYVLIAQMWPSPGVVVPADVPDGGRVVRRFAVTDLSAAAEAVQHGFDVCLRSMMLVLVQVGREDELVIKGARGVLPIREEPDA